MAPIRFGPDFELDLHSYQLRRAGRPVKLPRIPMEILLLLVERRPKLVTREQIVERIWGSDVFVDTDNSINGAIRKLRQALRDDSENPQFISTVTGMGYRFIAPVIADEATQTSVLPSAPEPAAPPAAMPARRSASRRPILLGAIAFLAAAVLVPWSLTSLAPPHAGGRVMLAVLPFENLTGDAGQDYFSDGFTEEIIARLGSVASRRLGVIARTSSMHYKESRASLDTIGRELGVQYVLEGSVRRDAERVRITAQLILVSDQSHLWSRSYDRQQTDVLTVQAEVARAIADQIQGTLGDQRHSPALQEPLSDRDYMAYDLYLKGRYFWNKRTKEDFERAIESFERSIDLNPLDARAHAGLADAYVLVGTYDMRPREEVVPKARAAALEALEIDPGLAAPYTSLALINEFFDWDWQGAEERFRRAIELDDNYATAHQWYAEYLGHQGRFDEALEEIEQARRLDPLSLIIAVDRAAILYYAGRYPESIDQFRAVMDVEPLFARISMIIFPYIHEKRFDEALALIQKWQDLSEEPWVDMVAAYVYGQLGRAEDARKSLDDMEESSRRLKRYALYMRTWANCGMGLREQVLASLQEACETRASFLVSLKVDPIYDLVRDDPRFQDLLRCVGLAS